MLQVSVQIFKIFFFVYVVFEIAAYRSFLFSKKRWREFLLAIGSSVGRKKKWREIRERKGLGVEFFIDDFWWESVTNQLPEPRGGWGFGGATGEPGMLKVPELMAGGFGVATGDAGMLGLGAVELLGLIFSAPELERKPLVIWEEPLLANNITSLALSAGKSLNTNTCPA